MLVDAPSEWGDSKLEDLESQNIWVITVSFPDAPWDCHRTADQARGGLGGQLIGSPMAVPLVVSGIDESIPCRLPVINPMRLVCL